MFFNRQLVFLWVSTMTSLFRFVPLLLLNKVHHLVSAKELAMPINFAIRDIDHILSLINSKFNVYVDHIYHMQRDIKTTTDTDSVILHTLITSSITWQWRPIMNETNDKETILVFSSWNFYLHVPIFQQNLHMESLICIHIIWLYLMSWLCRFGKCDLSLLFSFCCIGF